MEFNFSPRGGIFNIFNFLIELELKFIGTGSGKSSLKRYHSSFLINTGSYNLLVDTGDGISRALLNQKLIFNNIDGILISHLHPDHYTGLPGLIVQMKMTARVSPLNIFCHISSSQFIKEFIYQSYLFEERLGFKMNIEPFDNNKESEITSGLKFTARQNTHLQKNINSDKSGKLSFTCCSFLLKIKEKNLFFTGDIGGKKDLYLFQDSKINWMISELTHISIDELIEAFRSLNPQKLFITHLSEEEEVKISELSYHIPAKERKNVIAAFDGLSVKL